MGSFWGLDTFVSRTKQYRCLASTGRCQKFAIPRIFQGGTPILKGRGGCLSYRLGVKKVRLVSLRVFSLKRSKAGAFAVPLRVLSRKEMTGNHVLFWNRYLLAVKKFQAASTKQDLGTF